MLVSKGASKFCMIYFISTYAYIYSISGRRMIILLLLPKTKTFLGVSQACLGVDPQALSTGTKVSFSPERSTSQTPLVAFIEVSNVSSSLGGPARQASPAPPATPKADQKSLSALLTPFSFSSSNVCKRRARRLQRSRFCKAISY